MTPNAGENVKPQDLSFIAGGDAKWHSHSGRRFGDFVVNETYSQHTLQNGAPWCFSQGVENLRLQENPHMFFIAALFIIVTTWKDQGCPSGVDG